MLEITALNVADYLRSAGLISPGTGVTSEILTWGVSNVVIRVCPGSGPDRVVKQSREKLRTKTDWYSRLERIWREIDVMQAVAPLLPAGVIPRVLWEDRANFLFVMEAIDAQHAVWKEELLSGRADESVAQRLGEYLATIHRETAGVLEFEAAFGDREVFEELRIDPYYRHVAAVHVDLKPELEALIAETLATRLCIVHADFSPKNVLIVEATASSSSRSVSLVDFETGHYGDPAFDLGFFLTHLLLKTIKHAEKSRAFSNLSRAFWNSYAHHVVLPAANPSASKTPFPLANVECQAVKHLGACVLSRIDGKSTVDYLNQEQQALARQLGRELLLAPPGMLSACFQQLERRLK